MQSEVETGRSVYQIPCRAAMNSVEWNPKYNLLAFAADDKNKYQADEGTVMYCPFEMAAFILAFHFSPRSNISSLQTFRSLGLQTWWFLAHFGQPDVKHYLIIDCDRFMEGIFTLVYY